MRHIFFSCLVFQLLCTCLTLSAQKKVSILGDSYSTYSGYVTPANNRCFYGDEGKSDVEKVEQTWWHLFIAQQGCVLERNNSFSGATVCCTGYGKDDYSDRAFVTRCYDLGNPDIIFVFGGTNDSWAKSPVGEYQYAGWDKESLFAFRPAFAYLLQQLKHLYPSATIINISNSQLSEEVTTSMEVICRRYGIINVQLQNIEKQSGHPSIAGMKSICEQVTAAYKNQSDDRLGGDGHKGSAKVISDRVMLLEKGGKKLYLKVEGPEEIKWNISQAQSDYSYDSSNPGISLIGFDTDLKLAAKQQVRVYLLPDEKDRSNNI